MRGRLPQTLIRRLVGGFFGLSGVASTVPRILRRAPWLTSTERRMQIMSTLARPRGFVSASLADGKRVKLACQGDALSSRLFWQGFARFEPEALPIFTQLAKEAAVILDIGANLGVYSLTAGVANSNAKVFCFEPVGVVASQLTRNLDVNGLRNAVVVEAAVGNAEGTVPLFYRPGRVEQVASTKPGHRMTWEGGPWVCDFVSQVTIDAFTEQASVDRVDLVKIDVETAEPDVMEGMARVIARDRPHIFCEVFPPEWVDDRAYQRMEALLAPYGYFYYLLTPDGPVLQEELRGHGQYWNQLFTRYGPDAMAAKGLYAGDTK